MASPLRPPFQAAQLHGPVARLLRPLVRLFIRSGMTFPVVQELLRELYVQVAETEFALSDKDQTDSRVSLLTGVHRKEVRRLRGAGAPVSAMPSSLSSTSRILSHWLGSPEFSSRRGPKPLPRTALPDKPSFDALVESVTRDVRPRAVLDEWLHRGIVEIDARDRVVLLETALIPKVGDEQQLYYFGRNLHDHAAAAVDNISGAEQPRFLERALHYDGLSADAAEALVLHARELAVAALQNANREALALSDNDRGGRCRVNFGVFVYCEETPAPTEPSA